MQSNLSTGYAETALIGKSTSAGQAETMGLLEALVHGDAIFRDNGIRIHVQPLQLSAYRVVMIWSNGGLYEGVAPRLSKLHKFITALGVPFNTDWEVFRV